MSQFHDLGAKILKIFGLRKRKRFFYKKICTCEKLLVILWPILRTCVLMRQHWRADAAYNKNEKLLC